MVHMVVAILFELPDIENHEENTKTMTFTKFLKAYTSSSTNKNPETILHKGFTFFDSFGLEPDIPKSFSERKRWRDDMFRRIWTSSTELAVITYAEGDISVTDCTTKEAYLQELAEMQAFYSRK